MTTQRENRYYLNMLRGFAVRSYYTEVLGLLGAELMVYSLIASHTENEDYGCAFSGSMDQLAEATGMSVSTARRAISRLLEKKLIIRDERKENMYKYTVVYYADLDLAERLLCEYVDRLSSMPKMRPQSL